MTEDQEDRAVLSEPRRPVIVFDVNETLLDLDALRPTFDRIFNDPAAMRLWFGGICLIASHVWDTIGAAAAGWQTALILREGNAPLDVGPQPDYIGKDLDEIAGQLIERYASAVKTS
jgi:FMN phosphatase YigB (HAD superfamily)